MNYESLKEDAAMVPGKRPPCRRKVGKRGGATDDELAIPFKPLEDNASPISRSP